MTIEVIDLTRVVGLHEKLNLGAGRDGQDHLTIVEGAGEASGVKADRVITTKGGSWKDGGGGVERILDKDLCGVGRHELVVEGKGSGSLFVKIDTVSIPIHSVARDDLRSGKVKDKDTRALITYITLQSGIKDTAIECSVLSVWSCGAWIALSANGATASGLATGTTRTVLLTITAEIV